MRIDDLSMKTLLAKKYLRTVVVESLPFPQKPKTIRGGALLPIFFHVLFSSWKIIQETNNFSFLFDRRAQKKKNRAHRGEGFQHAEQHGTSGACAYGLPRRYCWHPFRRVDALDGESFGGFSFVFPAVC